MKAIFLSLFILFTAHANYTFGQIPIWQNIALEDGHGIKQLQTDSVGFIWGLSSKGLSKYDGYALTTQIPIHDNSEIFNTLQKDKHNNFIIGSQKGRFILYNPYLNKILIDTIYKEETPITNLYCSDSGNNCLLLSYGTGIIWKTQNQDTLLSTDNILISNEVYSAVIFENKAVIATDQGIQIIEKNGSDLQSKIIQKKDGLGDVFISNILIDENYIWASNFNSQLYKIDMTSLSITTFNLPFKSKINGIKIVSGSIPYVYSENGIFIYESNQWVKKFPSEGKQDVLDITLDKENNLWACSANHILSRANLSFQITDTDISNAQAILKTENSFWVGSSNGLFIIQGDKQTKISEKNITCISIFNDDILVGTFSSGILIYNRDGEILGQIDGWENYPNQSVLYIYAYKDEAYISSLTGVAKMRLTKAGNRYSYDEYYNLNAQLGSGYVYQILENNGDFFFATDRQGIKILSGDKLTHHTEFGNGNSLGSIYSMTKCSTGKVWFSSSIGYLGYLDKGEIYKVDNERILNDPYTSIVSIPNQKLVFVRNSSIDLYDIKSNHFIYYNNILQSSDQELFLNCFALEGNTIWLAKSNAIVRISDLDQAQDVPQVVIDNVLVNLLETDSNTPFAENQNNLEFKYSAAWLTNPERITYQYKLEGLDENWRTTRDKSITYPLLRPGCYTFKVKASQDGIFSDGNEQSYTFKIKKSFYKKWWFYLLSIILVGLLYRRWRNERRKVQFQKEALAKKRTEAQLISLQSQLNPHFLFNSFNTLIGLIEEDPARGIIFTEKLTDFYRDILDTGKLDLIPLEKEIKLLNTYIHLLKERFGAQIDIQLRLDEDLSYDIPPLTLQLIIENAVKHNIVSSNDPLIVTLTKKEHTITIINKLIPKIGKEKSTGIGLDNITKRHTLNNLRPPIIEKTATHFVVNVFLNSYKI